MPLTPFRTLRFRIIFFTSFWIWTSVHFRILVWYNFTILHAFLDSLVSNALLAGVAYIITIILRYYNPQKNRYIYILALTGIFSLFWLLISRSLLLLLTGESTEYNTFWSRSVPVRLAIGFLITGCMSLVCVLWYTIQDQQEIDKRKSEAERLSREAELFQLRQQLQPHFLFNSLNSINALIGMQPQKARTMIQQLSDFLRGTLNKDDQQWIDLKEELQHLQLYLDIEKVRFGHRLTTMVIDETDGMHLLLPALILQPVVENAIKFGLYDTTGAITISIEAKAESNFLILEVRNPYDAETSSPKKGTGFGLSSVQRRLYLLFARNDLLTTAAHNNIFITTIKIPQYNDQGDNHR